MRDDILDRLIDLHHQATTERSHYYVAKCCKDAMQEIILLREALAVTNKTIASLRGKSRK